MNDDDDDEDALNGDSDSPVAFAVQRPKKKVKRHRYGIKFKLKTLRCFDEILRTAVNGIGRDTPGLKKRVLMEVSRDTGVPTSTLANWTIPSIRQAIEQEVQRVVNNRRASEMKV